MVVCLKLLTFLADYRSEFRVFQILGPTVGRRDHFVLCYSFEKVKQINRKQIKCSRSFSSSSFAISRADNLDLLLEKNVNEITFAVEKNSQHGFLWIAFLYTFQSTILIYLFTHNYHLLLWECFLRLFEKIAKHVKAFELFCRSTCRLCNVVILTVNLREKLVHYDEMCLAWFHISNGQDNKKG